jgi:hypothetical protein
MGDGCNCDGPDVVVVYDRNLAPAFVDGNPYGRFCLNCGRRIFSSEEFWKKADEKHVIPKDEDWPVHVDDMNGDQYENFFECPADGCKEPHFGEPSGCDGCGADYNWD